MIVRKILIFCRCTWIHNYIITSPPNRFYVDSWSYVSVLITTFYNIRYVFWMRVYKRRSRWMKIPLVVLPGLDKCYKEPRHSEWSWSRRRLGECRWTAPVPASPARGPRPPGRRRSRRSTHVAARSGWTKRPARRRTSPRHYGSGQLSSQPRYVGLWASGTRTCGCSYKCPVVGPRLRRQTDARRMSCRGLPLASRTTRTTARARRGRQRTAAPASGRCRRPGGHTTRGSRGTCRSSPYSCHPTASTARG